MWWVWLCETVWSLRELVWLRVVRGVAVCWCLCVAVCVSLWL